MHDFLPFIVIGLATGAVYGLAGIGLVLTYKTSGILNFGYGAIAALSAFCFYFLHNEHGWAWPWAVVVCIFGFAPVLGLLLELMARSLDGATETLKVTATVGLILIVEALGTLWHPDNAPAFESFLPQSTIRLFGVNITWEQVILFVFSLVASAALYWFFQRARIGALMRAVVDNPDLVAMSAYDPVRIRRWSWLLGTGFSSVAGVLLASSQTLDGVVLTTVVFAAFGAASLGFLSNLPLTFAGGLAIGIGQALITKYAATTEWIGGLPPSLPFIVLFVVLIVTPARKLRRLRTTSPPQPRAVYHAPIRLRAGAWGIAIVLLALVPTMQASHLTVWSAALIDTILFASLGLLIRHSGLISLCHMMFAAVGAAAFGHLAVDQGMPWLVALLLATLIAVPVGAIIAIPAVRVSGVFLALATLGFAIIAEQLFFSRDFMFTDSSIGIAEPRPQVSIGGWNLASDRGFYYLLLIITVLAVGFVLWITHGRLGRLLQAMSNSPLALETQGASATVLKVIVFCIASALASLAGALTGMLYQFGVGSYFTWFNSVYIVVVVLVIAIGDPWYALIGAIAYAVIPAYIHGSTTNTWLQLLFGLGAVFAVYSTRQGTPPALARFLDRVGGARSPAPVAARTSAQPTMPVAPSDVVAQEGLTVRDLVVRFGGVKAVNGVSLTAPMGRITGLIGPNGAGKTTTFNACSGLNRPSSGQVLLHGTDVSRLGPARRARRGLGRTFQQTQLFDSLTVRQNVAMGREAPTAGGNPLTQLFTSRSSAKLIAAMTEDVLELTGTAQLADEPVGKLPIGQRRLVELARALAGPFDLLLLDEPSSGLDAHETEEFGQILTQVVAQRGYGILLVEHDMTLVRSICDYVYVLDFGAPIFEGTIQEMHASDQVRAAYLGDVETLEVPDETAELEGAIAGPVQVLTQND